MNLQRDGCDRVISPAHRARAMTSKSMFAICAVLTAATTACLGDDPSSPADTDDTAAAVQPATALHRVLFDAGHRQVAGNAFWIVDADAPAPVPASPTSAN